LNPNFGAGGNEIFSHSFGKFKQAYERATLNLTLLPAENP
jgi:hypothetical protein